MVLLTGKHRVPQGIQCASRRRTLNLGTAPSIHTQLLATSNCGPNEVDYTSLSCTSQMVGWCVHTVRCKINATVACTLTHHLAQCATQQPTYPGNLGICSLCMELCPGGSLHAGFIFPADSSHALIAEFCVRLTTQSVGLQLWGSAGSWSASIVAQCKDSNN